jgi:acetyl-CoA decarbonylase/synthase complex subunit gamma
LQLEAAAAPPIRLVTISSNGTSVSVGNETVLFRHEKTFYHAPGFFVRVRDTQPEAEVKETASQVEQYEVDYVGIDLSFSGMAVQNDSGDAETFKQCVAAVRSVNQGALILISEDAEVLKAGLSAAQGVKPLLAAATAENWESMAALAKEQRLPLVVRGASLDELAQLTQRIQAAGVEELVLDPDAYGFADSLVAMTEIRRLALKHGQRDLGFPLITYPHDGVEHDEDEAALAAQSIAKYAGFIVLDQFSPALAYPLLVLRQNIFTDPQKPIQVQPGLYEINDPSPDSPLMVTTNFSITYFSVANEISNSDIPGWLLVADAEGMSVLTAWAAGKFDASTIAKGIQTTNAADKVAHRCLIIPGQVAVLSGDLEEELPGWEILVGPREAVDLTSYLKVAA